MLTSTCFDISENKVYFSEIVFVTLLRLSFDKVFLTSISELHDQIMVNLSRSFAMKKIISTQRIHVIHLLFLDLFYKFE